MTTELSGLIVNYRQCDKSSELSPLPISSDWAGVSKSRVQNVKRLSRNPSPITGPETFGYIGSSSSSRNLSLFRSGWGALGVQGQVLPESSRWRLFWSEEVLWRARCRCLIRNGWILAVRRRGCGSRLNHVASQKSGKWRARDETGKIGAAIAWTVVILWKVAIPARAFWSLPGPPALFSAWVGTVVWPHQWTH